MIQTVDIIGLELFAKHGVFMTERDKGQVFIIDVKYGLDYSHIVENDSFSQTVCYNAVCKEIHRISDSEPCNLIETFAYRVANGLLDTFNAIENVDVTISKPDAPVDFKIQTTKAHYRAQRFHRFALGLGSNIGNRAAYIRRAAQMISLIEGVHLGAHSALYESRAQGFTDQPDFLNSVVIGKTCLLPLQLLRALKNIEQKLGRTPSDHWGAREIDIDLLCFGNRRLSSPLLTLPHPHMFERGFVLVPLAEIAPDWVINGRSVADWASTENWEADALCKFDKAVTGP